MLRIRNQFDDTSKKKTSIFKIKENEGSGDCLFLSLMDFLCENKGDFNFIPKDSSDLRTLIVKKILSTNPISTETNFDRLQHNIITNLQHELPILSDYGKNKNDNDKIQKSYAEYMSNCANFGTYTELCIAAEIFNFAGYIIQLDAMQNYSCYNFGFTDDSKLDATKPKIFLLFNGPIHKGHFRFLKPVLPKSPQNLIVGQYELVKNDSSMKYKSTTIIISNIVKEQKKDDFSLSETSILNQSECDICHRHFSSHQGMKIHRHTHGKEEISLVEQELIKSYNDDINAQFNKSNIFSADKLLLAEFAYLDKSETSMIENTCTENEMKNELKKCTHCPPELSHKLYAGDKGLKIHFSKQHKNIDSTIKNSKNPKDILETISSNVQIKFSQTKNGTVECDFCPGKFFQIPNGIKIHQASCKGTIANIDNNSNLDEFLDSLTKYKMETKVIKRIPNGARMCVAQKLTSIINTCLEENSIVSWQNLFLFPYRILNVSDKKKKNDKTSLTSKIKKNVLSNNLHPVISKNLKRNNQTMLKYVESKVFDGDIRGAIRILASDDSQLEYDVAIFNQLKEKHGFEPPIDLDAQPDKDQIVIEVTAEETNKSVYSFRNGSAGGIDGLRPQHLKDLLSIHNGSTEDNFLKSLTRLSNFMLAGKVNVKFLSIIYGASLIALSKKDGGIRPIAIGCTYRRLVSKLACKDIADEFSNFLQPKQLGFSVKGGCEAAVHATRIFIECNNGAELIIKIDVRNAFNSVLRKWMLQKVKEKFPRIYPYIHQCYANHSSLFFGDWKIDSATGCQQGDPLGPPLFCLVINECIQELVSELNVWYLDDGTLGGRGENVIEDLTRIKHEFSLLGLELNSSKCELYFLPNVSEERKVEISNKIDNILPGVKTLSENELTLLGAPLTENAVELVVEKKMKIFSNFIKKLIDLQPHVALFLLQHCLWIPKFTYLLRCCPMFKFTNYLKIMDIEIKEALESLLNIQLNENSLRQCFLPIKFGGLGIRLLSDIALPAFIASFNSSIALIGEIIPQLSVNFNYKDFDNALNDWKSLHPNDVPPFNANIQELWDLPFIIETVQSISDTDPKRRARMLAVTQKESGGWLQALPSPHLGTLLDFDTLRIAAGIRLGAEICQPYTCICGYPVDTSGTHGLSCIKKKGTFSRHFILNDLLSKALSTADFPSILEPPGLIRKDNKRPDGMTITPWMNGKSLVWDATCVDTVASSYLHLTSKKAGAAANLACLRKEILYEEIMKNHHFLPFAVETFGTFSESAKLFVKKIGPILNSKSGNVNAKSFFLQKISFAIQRGNVAAITGTIPPSAKIKEIFYLNN